MAVAVFSGLRRFFGRTISESAGYGIGGALQRPIEPLLQELTNETWRTSALAGISIPVDAHDAAEVVAEDVENTAWGEDQAAQAGMTPENFRAIVGAALTAPGLSELFALWRRDEITDADFTHGLRKARLETRWDAPLSALKARLLTLEELANARQQGFVDVARQQSESALQGLDTERADVLFELSGNPPGPATLQDAANRGLIDRPTFDQGIREGRTKTKYTELEWALRQPILHASDYANLWIRGWITESEALTGGALSGYTPEQMQLLYLNRGRPATTRQAFLGYTRGGRVTGQSWDERETFRRSVEQSDIRSEWEPILWAQRYTYPSAFVLRALTQAGNITAADAENVLLFEGWEPTFAKRVATAWGGGVTAKADPHVAKAQTQLWTRTHSSYLAGEIDDSAATTAITAAGVTPSAVADVLALWAEERSLVRKQLTPSQLRKAFREVLVNPATGAPWTTDEVIARLVAMGYSVADATTFVNE